MINYGKQWLDDDDINAVMEVLKSDFLTQGPHVNQFEEQTAQYTNAKYAVAVTNGTAALHLAVAALNPQPNQTGITCPNTFAASANCMLYNNMKPLFADMDEKTYCMDPNQLKKLLDLDTQHHTRVIIPIHFAGQPADMKQISHIVNQHNKKRTKRTPQNHIAIIEDAAHAIGSQYENGKPVGSCCYSDMTIFSFHPVKTIATGEGGMITTNNKHLYEKLRLLRNHGITKDNTMFKNHDTGPHGPWYYEMQALGFNYRMTDMQAALGTSQLKKINHFIHRRRHIVSQYNHAFKSIPWLTTPHEKPDVTSAFHLYVLKIDFQGIKKDRTHVMTELKEKGIGTQVHYIPVHLQPYYREHFNTGPGDCPKAEHYYNQCLSIPLYPKMSDHDVNHVINAITALYKN